MERGSLPLVKGTLDLLAEWTSSGPLALSSRDSPSFSDPLYMLLLLVSLALVTRLVARQRKRARSGTTPTCLSSIPPANLASLNRLDEVSKSHKNRLVVLSLFEGRGTIQS